MSIEKQERVKKLEEQKPKHNISSESTENEMAWRCREIVWKKDDEPCIIQKTNRAETEEQAETRRHHVVERLKGKNSQ